MSSVPPDRGHGRLGLRIAVWYAGVFTVSTVALAVVTYGLLSASLRQRDHQVVLDTLRAYAVQYETGGLSALAQAVDLEERTGQRERLFVRVIGPGSQALFWSLPPEWGAFDMTPLLRPGQGPQTWGVAPGEDRAANLEVTTARLPGGILLQVGKSTEIRDEMLRRFRLVAAAASLLALIVGLAGGLVVTRSTLQPIRNLIGVVDGIVRTGRTDERVPAAGTGDAIDELGTLFNAMLDRIGGLMAAMRDSIDNVAHDLRTPLARLRARAERAVATADPAAQKEALEACLEECDQILAILNTLMDISEAETGMRRLDVVPVDVAELLREVSDLYEAVAEDKQVTVAVEAPAGILVPADRQRLRQALANLVDNALKYTEPGGRVGLSAATRGHDAILTVTDSGAGIAPEHLPRIFDRLYRADPSRAERGLGLGLSLVKAYVQAHGGRVDVDSAPGRGSTFTVVLPLTPNLARM